MRSKHCILIFIYFLLLSCNSYRLKFNITKEYEINHIKRVIIEVHPPIELFHIILVLTDVSERDEFMLNKNTQHYLKIKKAFNAYKNEKIVNQLNKKLTNSPHSYHKFIKFLYCYEFNDNDLIMKEELTVTSSYKKYIPLIEDFAKKINFLDFFSTSKSYYNKLIDFQKRNVNTENMWKWLEENFSNKIQCYKTVFSSLTGGNHSVVKFNYGGYTESVSFVSAPYIKIEDKVYLAKLSGIVFTEIAHNYINPISKKNTEEISFNLSPREKWVIKNDITKYYGSPVKIFNEYLTHALFCLFASETYESSVADIVTANRINLMENLRGFKKFEAFTSYLLNLRRENPDIHLEKLYPEIINWFKY